MKRLPSFTYHEPATVESACTILHDGGDDARVLAGGTDLIVDLKTGRLTAATVVNLKRIPGLAGIGAASGGLRIGALTSVADVEQSELVCERHPALAQAAAVLASPPVRRMATIGGNVCRASPASDLAPPLIVLGAVATIGGPGGLREEPVEDLLVGPGMTTLAAGDVLTSLFVPDAPSRWGACHLKLGGRASGTDLAMFGVCAGVRLETDGTIAGTRIVLASVGPTPVRAREAEAVLTGAEPAPATLAAAGEAAAGEIQPIDDQRASAAYRTAVARVLVARAVANALDAAGGEA